MSRILYCPAILKKIDYMGVVGRNMYAYKESVNYDYSNISPYGTRQGGRSLHTVHERVYKRQNIQRPPKKKRSLISSVFILTLFAFFTFVIIPFSYKSVKNLFWLDKTAPFTNKGVESPILSTSTYYSGANLQSILFPTLGYMNNDMFLNQRLLAPTLYSKKYAADMYLSDRMTDLENQLKGLNKAFSSIKPAIYVWSFETGKYAAIDEDKVYPAASIIKIPVLVQLFKSIEASQVSIYDEMVLTHYYRASGSGDLQYAQDGRKYTLDSLAKVMIQNSDNSATNMLMSKIGGMDDINTGLRTWGLKNTHIKTWLPDLTGTNTTTAYDMAKILYNLENTSFLNINSREDIIKYMSKVKNNRLIQAGLPQGVPFIHKTGDIGTMLGDAGIVYLPSGQHYIVVILAKRPHNNPAGASFIKSASALIYSEMVNLK